MGQPLRLRCALAALGAGLLALPGPALAQTPAEEPAPHAPFGQLAAGEGPEGSSTRDSVVGSLVLSMEETDWAELRRRAGVRLARWLSPVEGLLPEGALDDLRDAAWSRPLQTAVYRALGLVVLAVVFFRLARGRGDLVVSIAYPPELRGTFHVRLARRRSKGRAGPRITSPEAAEGARRLPALFGRSRHSRVSRETQFLTIAPRRYFVSIDGFLQPIDGDDVVAAHFEEQEVRVERGQLARLAFDFDPQQCPVDVKVIWDVRPASDAQVAVRGIPYSLRYARGGAARLGLTLGSHTLLVGSGDRVVEMPLEIESFQPVSVVVDLTDRDKVVFSGCPPAVEPYLQGDVPAAARALEREGQTEIAQLLLAHQHAERDQKEIAAQHFERAGHPIEAAELHRQLAHYERAADLFEEEGEFVRAAEMCQADGAHGRAGELYARAHKYDRAAECFERAKDVPHWLDALEKLGEYFETAKAAIEHDDWARAIRNLEQVPRSDPHHREAVHLLIDAYERQGHLDLATRKIEEIVSAHGEEQVPLDACDRLAKRLEEAGEVEGALQLLDLVRRRDATRPTVGSRIEALRKQRSSVERSRATAQVEGAEAFSNEFRYEILEEVGRGGMGIVFKARDRRLGRIVALKRLPDNMRNHPKAVALFLREARSSAALNHPNIVTVFDAGQEGETYYITMELLEGYPLQQILRRRRRFSPRDTARLGVQITQGLQYAHEQRIVHRDIKTGNFFFTKKKTLKIMDFGLAKMVEEVRRASTVIGGTPYYMAPEQALGESVDHRADIYALGVTFFEMLTGKVPFPEGDVAYHHRHTPPPDPRSRSENIPEAFAELVLHMLAKQPDERCPSAQVVGERLDQILRSES
ncbi:MAG: protein kinase [Myxococcota bacterium]